MHDFMARPDSILVPVLSEHRIIRSYWKVVHQDLRNIRRMALVSQLLSEIVTRDQATF